MDSIPFNNNAEKATSKELMFVDPNKLHKELIVNNKSKHCKPTTKPITYKVTNSSVLDRVKKFIPEIATANKRLCEISSEEKEDLNIENITNDKNIIEMNISMVDPDLLLSDEEGEEEEDEETDFSSDDEQ